MDADGPGLLTHIWITVASPEGYHLKKLVCESIGTTRRHRASKLLWEIFFGLGLGEYYRWDPSFFQLAATKP